MRARRSSGSSRTTRRRSRGSRSRRRSSTSPGSSASRDAAADRRAAAARRPRASGARGHGRGRKHEARSRRRRAARAKPDGLLVVPPAEELAFLRALPVERIWGIGPATHPAPQRLRDPHGRRRRGAGAEPTLSRARPSGSRYVHGVAWNRDRRRVASRRRRGSFGSQSAGSRSPDAVDEVLLGLVDRVAYRMRSSSRRGRTVVLRLRFDDFSRATRSRTLRRPTAATREILETARDLFAETRPLVLERGLTLVGVAVSNLDDRFEPRAARAGARRPADRGARHRRRRRARPVRRPVRSPSGRCSGRDLRSMPWVADD